MQKFTTLISTAVLLPDRDIDTDQIIPARYLKGTQKTGLAANLFANWRYHEDGNLNEACILNLPAASEALILVSGDNFGCGSSREHAVWALMDYGFKAVVSTSFADIFRNNALRNGLLPVQVKPTDHSELVASMSSQPGICLTIDLETQTLQFGEDTIHFPVDAFAKMCLLQGVDELGYLLSLEDEISHYELSHAMAKGAST
jgi:3-isopropylmalate/(R)-2-methylmalate dehydratase small subunit